MSSHDPFPEDGALVGHERGAAPLERTRGATTSFGAQGTDATVKRIDLNDALIKHPEATFVMRAKGDSMRAAGIGDGDVLLVDRAVPPAHGLVVIAVVDGEMLCRRLHQQNGVTRLQTATPAYVDDVVLGDGAVLEVWGVVTTVIKSLVG